MTTSAPGREADDVLRLVAVMTQAGLTLATAESLTGGALAARVVDVPGASRVLRGGVVAYATELKAQLLGVDPTLLGDRGAVDPDVALAMAAGARERLRSDLGVATTGVAGPEPQDGVAPGTVYVAVDDGCGQPQVRRLELGGARAEVRAATVLAAVRLVLEVLGRD